MPRKKKVTEDPSSRSLHSSLMVINKEKPQQRNAANARERARMRVLSRAFYRLKTALTWVPADTKLSKLDTLRMAAKHISFLKGILDDDNPYSQADLRHPAMSLTWPFGFNKSCTTGSGPGDAGSEDGEDESGRLMDDGESLSCVSGSSWEEVKTGISVTPGTGKDRSHLDPSSAASTNDNNNSNPFNNPNFQQHPHLPSFHQNILSFS